MKLDQTLKREKRKLEPYYKDILNKHLDKMFFDRSDDIKDLMKGGAAEDAKDVEFKLVPHTPVCQECAHYLQGEILKKHLDDIPSRVFKIGGGAAAKKETAKKIEATPPKVEAAASRVYNKVK